MCARKATHCKMWGIHGPSAKTLFDIYTYSNNYHNDNDNNNDPVRKPAVSACAGAGRRTAVVLLKIADISIESLDKS